MEITKLAERYNLSRAQLQTRINFLGLKPIKTLQKPPFLTPTEVILLDDLHNHLAQKGNFSNYIRPSLSQISNFTKQQNAKENNVLKLKENGSQELQFESEPSTKKKLEQLSKVQKIKLLPEIVEKTTNFENANIFNQDLKEVEATPFYPDAISKEIEEYFSLNQRLKYNGILEELASRSWGLTAQEIKELTGSKPNKNYYQYDCFLFVKQGKIGNKITWRVIKQSQNLNFSSERKIQQIGEQTSFPVLEKEISSAEVDFLKDLQSMEEEYSA